MGENRKKVNAVLRKVAQNLERANRRVPIVCRSCDSRIEQSWNYCAACGAKYGDPLPSTTDRPFGCPPDEEAGE